MTISYTQQKNKQQQHKQGKGEYTWLLMMLCRLEF